MQLLFHGFSLTQFGGGQYSLAALLKETRISPLMVFYKLNLALEMY
jgi:hypothetical protein